MLISTLPTALTMRLGLSHSLRFQLLFTIIVGVILPLSILANIQAPGFLTSEAARNSALMSLTGVAAFLLLVRRISHYPGVNLSRHIIPSLTLTYGAMLAVITIARVPYSNTVLISTFLATVIASYCIAALNFRARTREFLVVPGGRADRIRALPQLVTRVLAGHELPTGRDVALIADLHHDHSPQCERLIAEAAIAGIPVYHYKQVWEATTGMVQIEHLSENHLGSLIPSLSYRKLKRAADLALAIFALPLVVPVFMGIAALIRWDSPGPAFFRQRRMGHRGRIFEVVKFRTMSVAGDGENAHESVTVDGDQRVTRVGRFLRRTRLDELPQIWNILKGEMSWIGPRPEAISLSRAYEAELPFYRYRHIVRPGITGWAQVNQGHVTSIQDVDDKLQYDFYYVKNFSYWIDLLILFRTIRVVITGFGAK